MNEDKFREFVLSSLEIPSIGSHSNGLYCVNVGFFNFTHYINIKLTNNNFKFYL